MNLRTTDPPSRMHSLQPEALRLQVSTISITIRSDPHTSATFCDIETWLWVEHWKSPLTRIQLGALLWPDSLSWDWGRKIDTKSSAVSKHILAEQSQSPSHPSRFLMSFLVFPDVFYGNFYSILFYQLSISFLMFSPPFIQGCHHLQSLGRRPQFGNLLRLKETARPG